MRSFQGEERSVQNEKCNCCKGREDSPLKAQRLPEHAPVPERPEPEHVHVIRQRRPTAEEDAGKDDQKNKEAASSMPRRMGRRPVNGLGLSSTPFVPASLYSVYKEPH